MKGITQYKIICDNCGNADVIGLDSENHVIWGEPKNIISARLRTDGQWGYQCNCGQNSLVTKQENENIRDLSKPSIQELTTIKKNLIVKKDKRFVMERI